MNKLRKLSEIMSEERFMHGEFLLVEKVEILQITGQQKYFDFDHLICIIGLRRVIKISS